MAVQTMDMNVDGFISCAELKKWLFPPPSQDYLRDLRAKSLKVLFGIKSPYNNGDYLFL